MRFFVAFIFNCLRQTVQKRICVFGKFWQTPVVSETQHTLNAMRHNRIKITFAKKTGKPLYYIGDGFWFGRISETEAKARLSNGTATLWEVKTENAFLAGAIAG